MDEHSQGNRVIAALTAATGAAVALALAVGLGSGGCFSPTFASCAVSCGEGSACPDDQFCLGDGKCHASQDEALCTPAGGDASVDDTSDDTSDDSDDTSDDTSDDSDDTDDSADDLFPPDAGRPDASLPDAGPPVSPTTPGDLVISEIHNDPVEADDPAGEWFEVFNPTGQTFEMQGLRIRDQDADGFDVDESVIVPPGGRVVFARIASPAGNGGVPGVDFEYGKTFALGNGDDEIVIENLQSGTVLDGVAYGLDFPAQPSGVSLSLDPDLENAAENDDGASWCGGSAPYGDGDLGSPGVPNPDC